MDIHEIIRRTDHSLLRPEATEKEILSLCLEAITYGCASACIPPSYVEAAYKFVGALLPICTVIGFPNGYMSSNVKVFEAKDAITAGASEIDMVINLGAVRERRWKNILSEILALREVCEDNILKVIIETCILSDYEKKQMCEIVSESGADFIKTSTGFGSGGATVQDVTLFREHCASHVKIKAAGGISSLDDAHNLIFAGADRLGSSRIISLAKEAGELMAR